MTSRPRVRRSRASSSASVVLPAAGGPSTATRSGCAVVTDSIAPASRSRSSPRVPVSMASAFHRVDRVAEPVGEPGTDAFQDVDLVGALGEAVVLARVDDQLVLGPELGE